MLSAVGLVVRSSEAAGCSSLLIGAGEMTHRERGMEERKREIAAGPFEENAGSALELTEADIDELFASA